MSVPLLHLKRSFLFVQVALQISTLISMKKGITVLSTTKYNLKQSKGSWGPVATTIPKKQGRNGSKEEGEGAPHVDPKDKCNPIVAFSRPPPLPPVIGPLIVLSMLDTWFCRDGNDD